MKKMKVAGVRVYATPNSPKGTHAVGIRVASKLNGNNDGLVGTYVEGAYDGRYTGFIANTAKFQSVESAEKYAAQLEKKYPRGLVMDSKKWQWGDELEDAPEGARVVKYIDEDGEEQVQDANAVREGLTATAPTA